MHCLYKYWYTTCSDNVHWETAPNRWAIPGCLLSGSMVAMGWFHSEWNLALSFTAPRRCIAVSCFRINRSQYVPVYPNMGLML